MIESASCASPSTTPGAESAAAHVEKTSRFPANAYAGVKASPTLLATLGVRPAIGRDFTDADALPGAARVALISDAP